MNTKEEFYTFEKKMGDEMNKYYESLGLKILYPYGNKKWDKIVLSNNKQISIEEKHFSTHWMGLLVEMVQDTATDDPGWYYHCEGDWLIVTMAENEHSLKPKEVYWVNWPEFKKAFSPYLLEQFKEIISDKGWGRTLNYLVPWFNIPRELWKQLEY